MITSLYLAVYRNNSKILTAYFANYLQQTQSPFFETHNEIFHDLIYSSVSCNSIDCTCVLLNLISDEFIDVNRLIDSATCAARKYHPKLMQVIFKRISMMKPSGEMSSELNSKSSLNLPRSSPITPGEQRVLDDIKLQILSPPESQVAAGKELEEKIRNVLSTVSCMVSLKQ